MCFYLSYDEETQRLQKLVVEVSTVEESTAEADEELTNHLHKSDNYSGTDNKEESDDKGCIFNTNRCQSLFLCKNC